MFTKHFALPVGISRYLSLVKTEENGTMAGLSCKRESDIMTHYFLRKVSTCGSMEGRVAGTGVHLGTRAVQRGQGRTGSHSRPRSSFCLPKCPRSPWPAFPLHPTGNRQSSRFPSWSCPVMVLSGPVPAASRLPMQWNPEDCRRRATGRSKVVTAEMREPVLRGPAFRSGSRRALCTYPGKLRTLLS